MADSPNATNDARAEWMLWQAIDFLAATLAKPDPRAWEHLLTYCPREVIEGRARRLADG